MVKDLVKKNPIQLKHMVVSQKLGVPQNEWFIMENPIKNGMIWGENPLFSETSICRIQIGDQIPQVRLTINHI